MNPRRIIKSLFLLLILFSSKISQSQNLWNVEVSIGDLRRVFERANEDFSFEISRLAEENKVQLYDFNSNEKLPKEKLAVIGDTLYLDSTNREMNYFFPFLNYTITKYTFGKNQLQEEILIFGRGKDTTYFESPIWEKLYNKNYFYIKVKELSKVLSKNSKKIFAFYKELNHQLKHEEVDITLLESYLSKYYFEKSLEFKKMPSLYTYKDGVKYSIEDSVLSKIDFKETRALLFSFYLSEDLKIKLIDFGFMYRHPTMIFSGVHEPTFSVLTSNLDSEILPSLNATSIFNFYLVDLILNGKNFENQTFLIKRNFK